MKQDTPTKDTRFTSQQALADALAQSGLPARAVSAMAALARPAVWLQTQPAPPEPALGSTRMGGLPDMPAHARWPTQANGQGLHFLAQINWAQVWAAGPVDEDMPRTGLLSIFYDADAMPWGYDPAHAQSTAVLWHDEPLHSLVRHTPPPNLPPLDDDLLCPPLACTPRPCWTALPAELHTWQTMAQAQGLGEAELERFCQWWLDEARLGASEGGQDPFCHRIGGWPTPLQGDMQTQAALVHAGVYCGGQLAPDDPAWAQARASAGDWLLLAQLGTDAQGGLYWETDGQLYLWIRRQDLRARRFDHVRLFLQCT